MNDDIHIILKFILRGIYMTMGVKVASPSVTHLTSLLPTIWYISYNKFFFPIWGWIELSFKELQPWLPTVVDFIKLLPYLSFIYVMLAHYSAADSVF